MGAGPAGTRLGSHEDQRGAKAAEGSLQFQVHNNTGLELELSHVEPPCLAEQLPARLGATASLLLENLADLPDGELFVNYVGHVKCQNSLRQEVKHDKNPSSVGRPAMSSLDGRDSRSGHIFSLYVGVDSGGLRSLFFSGGCRFRLAATFSANPEDAETLRASTGSKGQLGSCTWQLHDASSFATIRIQRTDANVLEKRQGLLNALEAQTTSTSQDKGQQTSSTSAPLQQPLAESPAESQDSTELLTGSSAATASQTEAADATTQTAANSALVQRADIQNEQEVSTHFQPKPRQSLVSENEPSAHSGDVQQPDKSGARSNDDNSKRNQVTRPPTQSECCALEERPKSGADSDPADNDACGRDPVRESAPCNPKTSSPRGSDEAFVHACATAEDLSLARPSSAQTSSSALSATIPQTSTLAPASSDAHSASGVPDQASVQAPASTAHISASVPKAPASSMRKPATAPASSAAPSRSIPDKETSASAALASASVPEAEDEDPFAQKRRSRSAALALKAQEDQRRKRQREAEERQRREAEEKMKAECTGVIAAQDIEFQRSLLVDQLHDLNAALPELRAAAERPRQAAEAAAQRRQNAEERLARYGENPRLKAEAERACEEERAAQAELEDAESQLAEVEAQAAEKAELLALHSLTEEDFAPPEAAA